jgi:hypothetical protein
MKHVRHILGFCLVLAALPACSSNDSEGNEPATAGSGSGGSAVGAGGGTAGTAVAEAGSTSAGKSGSAGNSDGGTASATGGSGGSGGAAAGGSGTAGSANEDELNCKKTDRGCLCAMVAPQPDPVAICSAQSVNGMCCESAATGFCSCREWSCKNDSLGCSCGSGVEGPLTKCSGSFAVCCLSVIGTASNCYCDDLLTECVGASDVKVPSCGIDVAPCGEGETEVDACKP